MSRKLSGQFFDVAVTIYPESGVIWRKGKMVKDHSWADVRTAAIAAGCGVQNIADGFEIRISPPVIGISPMEAMDKATKAHFVRGVNLVARFLDRETADLARCSMGLDEVIDWVERLADLSEAPQATLSIADAWLDEVRPSVPEPVVAPSIVAFGCEHCGACGSCDCEEEFEFAAMAQADDDEQATVEYLVAEDDGPVVDMAQPEMAEMCHIANTANCVTWDPRSNDIVVDSKVWPGTMSSLAEVLRETDGWRLTSRGDYELKRWTHDGRQAAHVVTEAKAHPEPVVIEVPPTEHSRVVILTPYGMFETGKSPHIKSYPQGWHLGRTLAWMQSKGWAMIERDTYRGKLRHVTFAKV